MGKENKKTFIAFFDLLGVKSTAEYDFKLYFNYINRFQSHLQDLVKGHNEVEIYAFSDCAYLESESLSSLLQILRDLRRVLFLERIYFNAAVTEGSLNATKKSGEKIDFTLFKSASTVKVFSLQVNFTGIGIFIDEHIKKYMKGNLKKLLIESAYCVNFEPKGISTFNKFLDVKFIEVSNQLLKYLIEQYLSTMTLNVKASRYYLSAINTLINQVDFDDLGEFIDEIYSLFYKDTFATAFLPIDLMFINAIYNGFREKHEGQINLLDEYNNFSDISRVLDKVIKKSYLVKGIVDLRLQSDCLISKDNKHLLANYLSIYKG
ncbi:MAG: hypothetical protein K2K85_03800 [Clostridia bacterium]|nr:hypothetical protein [Clostridia bacterium]